MQCGSFKSNTDAQDLEFVRRPKCANRSLTSVAREQLSHRVALSIKNAIHCRRQAFHAARRAYNFPRLLFNKPNCARPGLTCIWYVQYGVDFDIESRQLDGNGGAHGVGIAHVLGHHRVELTEIVHRTQVCADPDGVL